MNYVRTLLIITAFLFSSDHLHTAEPLLRRAENSDFQRPLGLNEIDTLSKSNDSSIGDISAIQGQATVEEKSSLDEWNDHLDLLTIKREYWDATHGVPLDSWRNDAFAMAEKIVKEDVSVAQTLKTSFFDAISAKVTLETKEALKRDTLAYELTQEFDQMIDNAIKQPVIEALPEIKPVAPVTIPEIVTPEPVAVSEPAPLPQSEATTTPQETTTTSQSTEQTAESLDQKWQEQLAKLKTEGTSSFLTFEILSKTYEAAQDLLRTDKVSVSDLQGQFSTALQARALAGGKKLYRLNDEQEIMNFNNAIGIFNPDPYSPQSYAPQQPMIDQNNRASQGEFATKESQLAADLEKLEKQQKKDKEQNMIELKALMQAQEEGKRTKQELHASIQEQKDRAAVLTKKHAELAAEMQEIRAKYAQQLAAAQKPAAATAPAPAKGIFSAITDPLYNWWYGTNPEEQATANVGPTMSEKQKKEQENILNAMVVNSPDRDAAKATLKEFDQQLLAFTTAEYWDGLHKRPNALWIKQMQPIVKDIVIKHKIMPLKTVGEIVEQSMIASKAMSDKNIQKMIVEIGIKVQEVYAEQQRQREAEEQRAQLKREKKEQKLFAQQRIKEEQARIQAEKERRIQVVASYKNQKKEWHDFLAGIGQRKSATEQDNHKLTQEALAKSQSLLQLAGEIPNKNKAELSQKLKQKFSVALLDQQRESDNIVNIHKNMDTFNQEINKILD